MDVVSAQPCVTGIFVLCADSYSALEGADVFVHYHPSEEKDAKDTLDYIKKVAPNSKSEIHGKDFRTEAACLETVEAVKKWSGGEVHIL